MKDLNQSTWDHEILYADKCLKMNNFYLVVFVKNRKYEVEGGWKLKFIFCFIEITLDPFRLEK
jgi:hypothetical protein